MATLVAYFQRLSFKLANLVFGKTAIFVVIIGWYLAITGLLFVINPQKARAKLVSSGFGIVKLNLLMICFFLWGLVTKLSQALSGIWQGVVFFGGLVGLVLVFLRARSAAQNKLNALADRLPVKVLTLFAWGQMIVGSLMVYFQRRLW